MIHQLDPKMLACVLPEGVKNPDVVQGTALQALAYADYDIDEGVWYTEYDPLPPGTWQIVGMASEVVKDKVDCFGLVEAVMLDGWEWYKDYEDPNDAYARPNESLKSLLTAHGITEEMYPRTVIVKMI